MAGPLVVIGAVVGQFVDPVGFALSAFIGAGMVFAGVTDTCGMGMMIAKIPWNRASNPTYQTSTGPLGTPIAFLCFAWKASSSSINEAIMGAI